MNRKEASEIEQFVNFIMGEESLQKLLMRLGFYLVDYREQRGIPSQLKNGCDFKTTTPAYQAWMRFLHAEDRKRVEESFNALMSGTSDCFQEVYRIENSDGEWQWISDRGAVVRRRSDGSPWIIMGVNEDLSRIKEAQEEASLRARQVGTLNATIEVITSSLDLNETVRMVLDQARRVVPHDRATVQVLHDGDLKVIGNMGFTDHEKVNNLVFTYPVAGSLSTRAIQERLPWISNDVLKDYPRFVQMEEDSPARSWMGVPLIAHSDVIGLISFESTEKDFYTSRHLEVARAFASPVAIALENARLHGETYRLAMEDALTGIGSRHAFDLNSRFLFEKARRENREFSLAMLDLDRFKSINDDFGHPTGDRVLKGVARACERNLRRTDLIARYGGEEIAIFFPDTNVNTAFDIVKRIRITVENLKFEGVNRAVTVSAGVAGCRPSRSASFTEIIRQTDTALYEAKAKGRNYVVLSDGAHPGNSRR